MRHRHAGPAGLKLGCTLESPGELPKLSVPRPRPIPRKSGPPSGAGKTLQVTPADGRLRKSPFVPLPPFSYRALPGILHWGESHSVFVLAGLRGGTRTSSGPGAPAGSAAPGASFGGVQRRAARSQGGVIVTGVTIAWPGWTGVWRGWERERRADVAVDGCWAQGRRRGRGRASGSG